MLELRQSSVCALNEFANPPVPSIVAEWISDDVAEEAHARFQRAIQRGHLLAAETAARELGTPSLSDACSLCRLYEHDRDPCLERAMRRWISRMRRECALRAQAGWASARSSRLAPNRVPPASAERAPHRPR